MIRNPKLEKHCKRPLARTKRTIDLLKKQKLDISEIYQLSESAGMQLMDARRTYLVVLDSMANNKVVPANRDHFIREKRTRWLEARNLWLAMKDLWEEMKLKGEG